MKFFEEIANKLKYPYNVHIPDVPCNWAKAFFSKEDLMNYLNTSKDRYKRQVRWDMIFMKIYILKPTKDD